MFTCIQNSKAMKKQCKPNKKKIKRRWDVIDNWNTENSNSNYQDIQQNMDFDIQSYEVDRCEFCSSELCLTEDGFMTCSSKQCAAIYRDRLDQTAEWRYYNGEGNDNPTRCGMPINPLLRESSFGCRVVNSGNNSYEMRKIRRYTEWQSMPYKEKSKYDQFERIKMMATNAGISQCIIQDALKLHDKISQEKTFRALNRDGIIAASIYLSCKMNNYPRTSKEIATIFHLNKSSATKGCKNATTILHKIERQLEGDEKTTMCRTLPISFIERYCSKLNINNELTKLCQFIAYRIEKNNMIPENTPHSVAAGIIYFVAQLCNLNITKQDVRRISEISEVTINKCSKKLDALKKDLVPECIMKKYDIKMD